MFGLPDVLLQVPQCARVRPGAVGTAWFSGQDGLSHIGLGDPGPAAHSSSKMGRSGAYHRGLGWPSDK